MTFFDYGIPLIALALGWGGVLVARQMARQFDRRMAEKKHHPAE